MAEIVIILLMALLTFGPPVAAAVLAFTIAPRKGRRVEYEFVSQKPIEEIRELHLRAVEGLKGYSTMPLGGNVIQFERKCNPDWTIVFAIVGAFIVSMLSLLFLLYKDTEICTVQFLPVEDGIKVQVSGTATEEFLYRLGKIANG